MKKLIFLLLLIPAIAVGQKSNKDLYVIKTSPALYLNGSGALINFNAGDVVLTQSTNTLTLSGGSLALGTNSLTLTGSIGATGARTTKVWATDIEVTNSPTVGGTSIAAIYAPIAAPVFTTSVTLPSGDTTVTAVLGKVIFKTSDSTFYGCRSTLANKKWYKINE